MKDKVNEALKSSSPVETLIALFRLHSAEVTVDLSDLKIFSESQHIVHLSLAIQHKDCSIQSLNLRNNNIGSEGARHLTLAIQHKHCSIQSLDLRNNNIGPEGTRHLALAIQHKHCSIQSLDLSENNIGPEGTHQLTLAIQYKQCSIQFLNLWNNNIGPEGTRHLALAIQHKHCSIQFLNLWNNNIGPEGARHLALAIQHKHCSIQLLDLGNNRIGPEGACHLALAIQHQDCCVQVLSLGYNNIGPEGAQALILAIQNPHSQILKIKLDSEYDLNTTESLMINRKRWGERLFTLAVACKLLGCDKYIIQYILKIAVGITYYPALTQKIIDHALQHPTLSTDHIISPKRRDYTRFFKFYYPDDSSIEQKIPISSPIPVTFL